MSLGKGFFKNFFDKLNTIDLILNSILTFCISVFLFYVVFPNNGYFSLKDFFVGETIYKDYNKYFDILFVFMYFIVFFAVIPIFKTVKNTIFLQKIHNTKFSGRFVYFLQYLSLLSFLLLYPSDGNFYPVLSCFILFFIGFGAVDIWKKQNLSRQDNVVHFSYIAVAAIVLLCFGRMYDFSQVFIDPHHDAEHFCAYYMHTKHNMIYYKDIMLVHGYRDIVESWLGQHIFGTENLYTYFLGKTLYFNMLVIIFSLLGLYVFQGNPVVLITFVSLFRNDDLTVLFGVYLLVFFALIKEQVFKKYSLFLSLYTLLSFLFIQYWTTMGILWAVSVFPAAVYVVVKIFKDKNFKALLYPAIIFLICIIFCAKGLYYFFGQAVFYTQANLYGFGTVMPPLNLKNCEIFYKMAAVVLCPVLITIAIKEFLKDKQKCKELVFILCFTIILIFSSLNYTMGRIDADSFTRLLNLSINLLFVILPYLCYRFAKTEKITSYITIIALFWFIYAGFNSMIKMSTAPKPQPQTEVIKKQGLLDLRNDEKQSLKAITNFINKYTRKDDTFFDLTNKGILYFILDKKVPLQYTSYYNIVSNEQAQFALQKLKQNEPDVIYMDTLSEKLDGVFPSLRITPIYRYILLNNRYKLVTGENMALLVKTDNSNNNFSRSELSVLDKMLAASDLQKLPDVWGKSINKLPVEEVFEDYKVQGLKIDNTTFLNIHFNKPAKGKDLDLLYISVPAHKESNWLLRQNNSDSIMSFKSSSGEMLIPLDNFPSWLLNSTVTDITIQTNADIDKNIILKFYKRTK